MKYGLLEKVIEELNKHILPAKVSKIYQPDADIIIFKLWNGKTNYRLLLSAEPGKSRIHLTRREWLNPSRPPRFCQLLRARLGQLDSIALKDDDRIVSISAKGERGECRLVAELTGKAPNLILVDAENQIIDVLNRVCPSGSHRSITAGEGYLFPEVRADFLRSEELLEISTSGELVYNSYAEGVSACDAREARQDLHQSLIRLVQKQKKKVVKRLERINADLARQENAEVYKIKGELLLAHLHQLRRGMVEVDLPNYYMDPPDNVKIELDPRLDGHENAQRYFKTYKKFRRGVEHHLRRILESEEELSWLDVVEYQLNDTVKRTDIEDIAQELRSHGLLKDEGGLNHKRTSVAEGPREVFSPSGLKVVWGRNNRQNDQVTTRIMKTGDLWFHAHKVPGAHVVLKTAGNIPSEEDIQFAAGIAAGYSKAKEEESVEVMEAVPKNVEKKKGSHPGQVFVKDFKVRFVAPLRVK